MKKFTCTDVHGGTEFDLSICVDPFFDVWSQVERILHAKAHKQMTDDYELNEVLYNVREPQEGKKRFSYKRAHTWCCEGGEVK